MNLFIVCTILLLLLFFGFPVALTMGVSGIVYFLLTGGIDYFPMIVNRIYGGIDSFVLICIPFFILAGDMMNRSGITERLVNLSNLVVGRLPGSLAQANIVASGIFASISGSALGDVAAIGSVFIPAMKKEGFSGRFSAAVTGASAIVSPIIPPSLIIILYAAVMDTSIGAMFVAAIIPGFLMVVGDMVMVHVLSVKRNYPRRSQPISRRDAVKMPARCPHRTGHARDHRGGNCFRCLYPHGSGRGGRTVCFCGGGGIFSKDQFQRDPQFHF
jgi:tripartite ATP-independent transporter DctM subunit